MHSNYLADKYNIGKKEKIKFYIIGVLGTIVTIHLSLYFIISPYKWWMLIAVFIPSFSTSIAFLQAINSFKVNYKVLFNSKNSNTPEAANSNEEENKKAKNFILISSVISLLWCVVIFYLSQNNEF